MTRASAASAPASVVRRGLGRSWHDYGTMLRWHFASLRLWMALLAVVQVLSGVGLVLAIGLFFQHIPHSAALYVSTGAPVLNMVMVGLILGPQLVANQKTAGGYEYLRAMPVSRCVNAVAWYTVCLVCALPAMAVTLCVASLRYNLELHVTAMVVPAVLLTTFTATMLGYALAHAINNATAIAMVTQAIVFVVFGFAPIIFPMAQMPRWLATVNWWFPFRHMAVATRAGLTPGSHAGLFTSYSVLVVWSITCALLAGRALGRRQ
jgi:ABC-2 type transport system permease protein